MIRSIAILFLLLLNTQLFASEIASLEFNGLTRTKESFLREIIQLREGKEFTETAFEEDLFLLRNLNLFFDVQGKFTEGTPGFVDLHIEIKEANYIYPIISASGFDDQLKLQFGANDINFLGRAQSFGILYQFYDRHSFSAFHSAKRHFNNKTGHELAIAKYSTLEPLYFFDTVSTFNFDNYSASAGGFYWLGRYLNAGIGGAYMYEQYEQRDNAFSIHNMTSFAFHKHQLRSNLHYNKVEHVYERRSGLSWNLYGEWIHTYGIQSADASFLKLLAQTRWYTFIGKRGNFALNSKFGLASNNDSPFSPFVLDGFLNVRGIGNRVERGTAEFIVNTEYQHRVFKHKYCTLQLAGFADYGTLRLPGDALSNLFASDSGTNIFLGGGIRLHLNIFYKTCIRIDYSMNPLSPDKRGFTFGFGQFF